METKRLRLEGATLPDLQARVLAEHGAGARIIAAEQVTVGGIRGYFAKRHVEVTVEVPVLPIQVLRETPAPRRRGAHSRDERTVRLGIAALLDEADEAEVRLQGAVPGAAVASAPATSTPVTSTPAAGMSAARAAAVQEPAAADPASAVSTGTPDFARLMDELTFATSRARAAAPAAPSPAPDLGARPARSALPDAARPAAPPDPRMRPALTPGAPTLVTGPGDLVLLVGMQSDVHEVTRMLSSEPHPPIDDSVERVNDRRAALAARARGVEQGRGVVVTCGLPEHGAGTTPSLALLQADQVWAVVHAGRKTADTARWVRDVGLGVPIDAVMVLGVETTDTPGTVAELGLPIGWLAPPASAGPKNPIAIG